MGRKPRKAPKRLGEKMREVRLRMDLTQGQVAEALGTESGSVSRFESGERQPSLLEILEFSKMSGVGIEILIDDQRDLAKKRRR